MARANQRLNALAANRATKPGYYPDGSGLYLQVTTAQSKSWIYRFALAGRRREMGLGPFPAISLAEARETAGAARSLVKSGRDPIEAREAERARLRLEAARGITFDEAVRKFFDAHEGTWRNPKHRQQWRNSLKTYASPKIGTLWVGEIGTGEVTRVLDPIWTQKPETAGRVRGRIERILDWAKVRGFRSGENPARWRGHLDAVFPAPSKVRQVKHHAAVPIDEMPTVYGRLRTDTSLAALAARFTILTAVRAGETTGATWDEMDLDAAIWSISAERMKANRPHKVPLSTEAISILKTVKEMTTGDKVFPGQRAKRPLSLTALIKALRRAGADKATTHGGRSTFKDWASERTGFPPEVSEMALAHAIGDKTEAAYRRGELLQKRAAMMEQWATFLCTVAAGTVVKMERRSA